MAIVGEPISKYVADEINFRQKTQFKGYGNTNRIENVDTGRVDKNGNKIYVQNNHLPYLNNQNAWVKMASSVYLGGLIPSVTQDQKQKDILKEEATLVDDFAYQRLKSLGLKPENFKGNKLAEKFILFNGVSEVGKPNRRSGLANNGNLWNDNAIYGLGGKDFGIQPSPGISDLSIECLNRGSIRKATINLKAYNKFQFEIIELLYLRVGFHILIELGNDKYYNDAKKNYENVGNTILETSWFESKNTSQLAMLDLIQTYRKKYRGNYEGFFGRVTNFTWDITPEGTYDITLELHTIGDVIESLQVNFPAAFSQPIVSLPSGSKKEVVEEAIETTLDAFLYSAEQNECNDDGNKDYINVSAIYSNKEQELYHTDIHAYADLKQTKESYTKYIRLGELFNILTQKFLPSITSDGKRSAPLLQLNLDEEKQLMGYHLNQTPLDPRVCTFKVPKTEFIKNLDYPLHMDYINDFIFYPQENVVAGKILNLYLNFAFIKKAMKTNVGQDGKLSLFKFLQNICNGLNEALGNVNKLEPVIIDDNKVSIIDQNPIPGLIETQNVPIEFQTFGYNEPKSSASIIRDINLTTSITPEMATMVTIGATARGGNVKGIDSTYFSKWNAGLNDRFNLETTIPELSQEELAEITKQQLKERYSKEWDERQAFEANRDNTSEGQRLKAQSRAAGVDIKSLDTGGSDKIEVIDDPLLQNGIYTKQEYVDTKYIFQSLQTDFKKRETEHLLKKNYYYYLVKAFGSRSSLIIDNKTEVPPNDKPRLLEFNQDIISIGKASYSEFLRVVNRIKAEEEEIKAKKIEDLYSSDQIGFIPFNLGITMDGISGLKIYNKISIDQRFLPDNYPKSIHFISTKVNHYVKDNDWTTQLETLVLPKTKTSDFILKDIEFEDAGSQNLEPEDERGPKIPKNAKDFYFKYSSEFNFTQLLFPKDNNIFGDYGVKGEELEINDVLKDIHPDVKGNFEGFLTELKENYPGYHAIISAIYRSPSQSDNLKNQLNNQSVAAGGNSYHNYAAAIDFNLYSPKEGRYLKMKGDGALWQNHGIPALAAKYNIDWGGWFRDKNSKEDAVHFYVPINTEIAKDNIALIQDYIGRDVHKNKEIHLVSLRRRMSEDEIEKIFIKGENANKKYNVNFTFPTNVN